MVGIVSVMLIGMLMLVLCLDTCMSTWTELSIGIRGGLVQKFYKTTTIATQAAVLNHDPPRRASSEASPERRPAKA